MLLASFDPTCRLESRAAASRAKKHKKLSSDYVSTTTIADYNALKHLGTYISDDGNKNKESWSKTQDSKCSGMNFWIRESTYWYIGWQRVWRWKNHKCIQCNTTICKIVKVIEIHKGWILWKIWSLRKSLLLQFSQSAKQIGNENARGYDQSWQQKFEIKKSCWGDKQRNI